MENKKYEISDFSQFIGVFAILLLVVSLAVSMEMLELRPLGVGIMLFGIFYFGSFTRWSHLGYQRDRATNQKFHWVIFIIVFAILAAITFLYGLALFLHHYDIDQLIDIYSKAGRWIDSIK
jgi:hypothetical protein